MNDTFFSWNESLDFLLLDRYILLSLWPANFIFVQAHSWIFFAVLGTILCWDAKKSERDSNYEKNYLGHSNPPDCTHKKSQENVFVVLQKNKTILGDCTALLKTEMLILRFLEKRKTFFSIIIIAIIICLKLQLFFCTSVWHLSCSQVNL